MGCVTSWCKSCAEEEKNTTVQTNCFMKCSLFIKQFLLFGAKIFLQHCKSLIIITGNKHQTKMVFRVNKRDVKTDHRFQEKTVLESIWDAASALCCMCAEHRSCISCRWCWGCWMYQSARSAHLVSLKVYSTTGRQMRSASEHRHFTQRILSTQTFCVERKQWQIKQNGVLQKKCIGLISANVTFFHTSGTFWERGVLSSGKKTIQKEQQFTHSEEKLLPISSYSLFQHSIMAERYCRIFCGWKTEFRILYFKL